MYTIPENELSEIFGATLLDKKDLSTKWNKNMSSCSWHEHAIVEDVKVAL